jgi:hypothetical protein
MKTRLRFLLLLASPILLRTGFTTAEAQVGALAKPLLNASSGTAAGLPTNSISHLTVRGSDLWLGTGKGLARTTDGGLTFSSFRNVPQFPTQSVFSLDIHGQTIWCSTGYTKDVQDASVQTGTGYAFSADYGSTWHTAPQPLDGRGDSLVVYGINTVRFLPIVVPEQNVTFDLAVTDSAVWVASWSSGLRKSTDNGQTWKRTVLPSRTRSSVSPTDTLGEYVVNPLLDNNFLLFSVYPQTGNIIWAGSAGGVNKSTDGGISWRNLTVDNLSQSFLGNWVIAIKGQALGTRTRVWITDWPAEGPNEVYGISCTDDSGATWQNFLAGTKAYDFAFKDSIVYVASDDGLFRSSDVGRSWVRSGSIVDPASGNTLTSSVFYAVAVIGDTVYGGNADGLVRTVDNGPHPFGSQWDVLRTNVPVGSPGATYAYPNPFSPRQGPIRIHYSTGGVGAAVTIELFDFGMNRVRTLLRNAQRSGTAEHDEIWDGKNDGGSFLPNGVYFYRVTVGDNDPAWGKVMVLQ